MKIKRNSLYIYIVASIVFFGLIFFTGRQLIMSEDKPKEIAKETSVAASLPAAQTSNINVIVPHRPKYVRGIHLTSWVSGHPKLRASINQLLNETELNTVVIDIKEYEGEIYIPFKRAQEYKSYIAAIPDIEKYLADLKSRGIYTIARIVVFKDNILPKRKPEWAVKDTAGNVWKDRKGIAWADPYRKEVWDYNLDLAERAIDLGFEEIQFDYIRFPSDGNIHNCVYSQKHSSTTSAAALVDFLKAAHGRLKPRGANISIDVFGLTTTVPHDMGIGQKIVEMTNWVDFVSPMVYPSHYNKGEYNIPDPNKAPYRTVYLGLSGAKKKLGAASGKLRPYLQDFSLGHHYGPKEVREQIQASYDNDIGDWLLWNPRCVYTRGGLKNKEFMDKYENLKKEKEVSALKDNLSSSATAQQKIEK